MPAVQGTIVLRVQVAIDSDAPEGSDPIESICDQTAQHVDFVLEKYGTVATVTVDEFDLALIEDIA
jgi:hypothetical protein